MRIEWAEVARDDLREIREYIGRDSEMYAKRTVDAIVRSARRLGNNPKLGKIVPERRDDDVREIRHGYYRLIYRIEEDRILVLGVIHGRRDLANLDRVF